MRTRLVLVGVAVLLAVGLCAWPGGQADVPTGFPNDIRWLDSIMEYIANSPEARTVGQYPVFSTMDVVGTQTYSYPADGVPLDGARSAMLVLQWKSMTGAILVTHYFSASAADTNCTSFPMDTVRVDSVNVRQNATLETVTIPVKAWQGGVLQGYYHVWIRSYSATDIENVEAALVVVW